jgi:hypothetical protein
MHNKWTEDQLKTTFNRLYQERSRHLKWMGQLHDSYRRYGLLFQFLSVIQAGMEVSLKLLIGLLVLHFFTPILPDGVNASNLMMLIMMSWLAIGISRPALKTEYMLGRHEITLLHGLTYMIREKDSLIKMPKPERRHFVTRIIHELSAGSEPEYRLKYSRSNQALFVINIALISSGISYQFLSTDIWSQDSFLGLGASASILIPILHSFLLAGIFLLGIAGIEAGVACAFIDCPLKKRKNIMSSNKFFASQGTLKKQTIAT